MRYIKILLLALFIFFAVLFFIQNQAPLSQEMALSLNLFFIPPFTSIPLPFYFVVVAAFVVGCILSALWLLWDKFNTSAKLMKSNWKVTSLEKEVAKLKKQLEAVQKSAAENVGAKALPAGEDAPQETQES